MSDEIVRVRYVGPQTEGLWIDTVGELPHNEWVDVPRAVAEDLARQCEPDGEPTLIDAATGVWHQPMRPVFETDPAIAAPDHSAPTVAEETPPTKAKRGKATASADSTT